MYYVYVCVYTYIYIYNMHKIGASLVDQLVKNPPAVLETWVPSLGGEDPLEEGTATHSKLYKYVFYIELFHISKSNTGLFYKV